MDIIPDPRRRNHGDPPYLRFGRTVLVEAGFRFFFIGLRGASQRVMLRKMVSSEPGTFPRPLDNSRSGGATPLSRWISDAASVLSRFGRRIVIVTLVPIDQTQRNMH